MHLFPALVLLVGMLLAPLGMASEARAACHSSDSVVVSGQLDGFDGAATSDSACESGNSSTPSGHESAPGSWHHQPVCLGGLATCDAEGIAHCDNGQIMEYVWFVPEGGRPGAVHTNCPSDSPDPGPVLADVIRAFEHIPLPNSVLIVQPPGGETLVNFKTNFLTEAGPFDRSVTLLGHAVDFRIRPARFHWHYGDGDDDTTSRPGDRYPNLDVTHRYRSKGRVTPSVDTTWEADYRVDGGGWAPVPDTVTKTGATQALRVRTATPVLVGY